LDSMTSLWLDHCNVSTQTPCHSYNMLEFLKDSPELLHEKLRYF
jgi:hypothetical protein